MRVKRALLFIPALLMASPILFSCSSKDPNATYLRILNSEDYIADGLIEDFEKLQSSNGKKVKVIYETFDTMENMFNTLKTGKTKYDLVCASDYMVQKLVNKDLLEKLDSSKLGTYSSNVSSYIDDRLENIEWGKDNKYNLKQYCTCYMWGTLGILYNPNFSGFPSDEEIVKTDMTSWNALWNKRYKKTIAIKDSMRDTYAVGLIHSYQGELEGKSVEERQKIFDYGGETDKNAKKHIDTIKKDLLKLRDNIFGFEVDSGKEDIVTEKIGIDMAWSGDAVKAINSAEKEKKLKLYYTVPSEGSNLWFDCWTIQKGANKDLAYKFLNFLSEPSNAIKNMNAIGYTSAIAGANGDSSIYNYFSDKYKPTTGPSVEHDVSYFFNDGRKLTIDEKYLGRQISAQLPTKEEADNLMVMKDYGDNNDLILKMWEEVKHESLPTWAIVLFVVEIAAVATVIVVIISVRIKNKKQRKARKIRAS